MHRFLTINCIVRKNQIEITRDRTVGHDETEKHSAAHVQRLADIIRQGMPDAKITWAFSWCALTDQSDRYRQIRAKIKELHELNGDDVTFIPGGYFANRYNTREQVNRDISDAFRIIEAWLGHKPQVLIAGFLSSANIAYARNNEGVIGVQGNIWSQYAIDNQDGDGSIAYPYYPSTEHFCKPAQNPEDFIDCLNFDGWTVDFFNARLKGGRGPRKNSRLGVGPIETLGNFGAKNGGMQELLATTTAHFGTSAPFNPFTWVTTQIEVCLLEEVPDLPAITDWLRWIRTTWPDVQCPPLVEFARWIRERYPNNQNLRYELHQKGDGVGVAKKGHEIVWYMNKNFRCGIEIDRKGRKTVFDYTRYSQHYQEPQGIGERNWSIFDILNQKEIRKQDKPLRIEKFSYWDEIQKTLSNSSGY
jgi:hypothetical protein